MTRRASSKRTWRKRLLITGLVLFTLYLAFGVWGVPAILKSQIGSKGSAALGREVSLERASFNPFSMEVKLYGLKVGPAEGESENLLEVGKLTANPQLASVFGTVTVKSIEVSDGDVRVALDSTGTFSFQDILDTLAAAPEPEADTSGEMPLVIVKDLLLSKLRFHYRDASLATSYQETITIEAIAGRDLGTVEKSSIANTDTDEASYHWDFDGLLTTESGATLNLKGGAESITPWRFKVDAELAGFPLESLQPYVDESVLAKVAGTFGFDLTETVELTEAGPAASVRGEFGIDSFSVADAEQAFARWESFQVSGIELDASSMELSVKEVLLKAPQFEAILLADGSPRLPEMKTVSGSSSDSGGGASPDFKAALGSVVISRGHVSVEDRSLSNPFRTNLENLELGLSSLEAQQSGGAFDASGALSLAMDVLGGKLELKAALESLEGLSSASLSMAGIQLQDLQPYVSDFANADLQQGTLGVAMDARLQAFANPQVKGSLGLQGLKVTEGGTQKDVATLTSLEVSGLSYSGENVDIESVILVEPIIGAWQDDAGMNLARLAKIEQEVERKAVEMEDDTGVKFTLGRLELKGAGVGFVDTTPVSTHNSRVSDFDLLVEGVSTDPEKLANFEFSGTVDGSARVAGKGALSIGEPGKHLDLDMSFRGYDLTSTSPYWATYLGRELSKGQFEISSRYEVRNNQLKGTNDFKIDQLTLGEKVDSERAINLPLGFAINLMRDPSGVISYDGLSVEGDLADPQVKPWGLVGKAFRNLILNAVASPFKFLAKISGGPDDLDSIGFAVAELELNEAAREKVQALRKFLIERPGQSLEVGFLPDPAEARYLKEQYMLHRIATPEYQVVSGLDLLEPVDRVRLEQSVQSRYAALIAERGIGVEASEPAASAETVSREEADVKTAEAEEDSKGLVQRLAGIIGLGKKDKAPADSTSRKDSVAATERNEPEDAALATVEKGPSFDEKLATVVDSMPAVELDENWSDDLASERIRNFKIALIADEAVDSKRVFSVEVDELEAKGELGSLLVSLTD